MSWQTVKLGDVCEVVSGATPSTSVKDYWDGNIWWATPKDLSGLGQKIISQTARQISTKGLESCSAKLLPARSVLFSSRAPIGLVAINEVPMATNQGFKSFIVNKEKIDESYLYWWLKKNRNYIELMGVGATFKEVSKSIVERIQIPLPPLAEQERIATNLDKVAAIKAKRNQVVATLDALMGSLSEEYFGAGYEQSRPSNTKPLQEGS